MSESAADFTRYVPGFDFLQNLAKGASKSLPQMPSLAQWVAPTMDVKELDKRINDLKAVQFWLDQNARALAATIQALEVQKHTLATLLGMNVGLGDMAKAFQFSAPSVAATEPPAAAPAPRAVAAQTPPPEAKPKAVPRSRGKAAATQPDAASTPSTAKLVDPLQLWGSLTQQFQQIAAAALKDTAAASASVSVIPDAAETARSGQGGSKTAARRKAR